MPEGPEIRRAADALAAVLLAAPLTNVFFEFARLKRFQRRLIGEQVTAIDTHGKAILTRFSNDLTMFSHNQLYGRWYVMPGRQRPETNRSLRVGLYTAEHSALLYSASSVEVLTPRGLAENAFLKRLGPDILDGTLSADGVAERLASGSFRNRSLGVLLLDQGFLAGTGNYLRSEILHFAGLAHGLRPRDLDPHTRRRLARQILSVARRSYRTGGLTNPPRRVAALKRQGCEYAQYRFAAFGRAGEPCYACGTRIQRIDVSSRRLYFCPICQPAAG